MVAEEPQSMNQLDLQILHIMIYHMEHLVTTLITSAIYSQSADWSTVYQLCGMMLEMDK